MSKKKPTFIELQLAYCRAANALNDYRDERGLEPGKRVRCQYQDRPEKYGVIEEYGQAWLGRDATQVPVRLDDGTLQPWSMDELTLV